MSEQRDACDWIISVDFDGTLVEHEFPDIGPEVPGAFDWLIRWQSAGARLILWTMRSDGRTDADGRPFNPLADAVAFCLDRGVEFWAVNRNPQQSSWTDSPKCYAHLTVDDAAFGCPLVQPEEHWRRPYADWAIVGPAVYAMITGHAWTEDDELDEEAGREDAPP